MGLNLHTIEEYGEFRHELFLKGKNKLKGQEKCERCYEFDWLNTGLCGKCIETLRLYYPDKFEEVRQRHIQEWDKCHKR